ncbi:MAG TPA: nucleotide exchange factor GrpE [Candidatus Saccharimonadales bacterium]|nr:nucleotide exchange factor GrpE [Candidatus Saccharimonadales bacterium]
MTKDKTPKTDKLQESIDQLTADLQRTRADFENYRKRVEAEKESARSLGKTQAVLKLLPVIDNIERAIGHLPDDLRDHKWAQGVTSLVKNLDKSLEALDLKRIDAKPGTVFDPALHEAIQMDEDSEGETEVIAEELQPGYLLSGQPIRHAFVKVKRQ